MQVTRSQRRYQHPWALLPKITTYFMPMKKDLIGILVKVYNQLFCLVLKVCALYPAHHQHKAHCKITSFVYVSSHALFFIKISYSGFIKSLLKIWIQSDNSFVPPKFKLLCDSSKRKKGLHWEPSCCSGWRAHPTDYDVIWSGLGPLGRLPQRAVYGSWIEPYQPIMSHIVLM